ncbi:MAG: ABC transporter ATP-binding protein [Clostridia bacterium]|nr:ABC transporter ATP-binding protein [Clostridia bacterium]
MEQKKQVAIEMRGVTKAFGSLVANKDVDLCVYRGEILALLGENGSGKTTLMNMLSGIYYPDAGEIFVDGKSVSIRSPKDAFECGIGMIHQHFKLVDIFSAVENVALAMDSQEKYNLKAVAAKMQQICDRYGFELDIQQKVYDMTVSQKQTLEIIKVLYRGADFLILDEPTAVLTPQEADKLFQVIRNMREDGKSVIIITHKLHEVLDISDRVTILRKGQYIGTVDTKDATEDSLTEMMVGQKVELNIDRPEPVDPEPRLILKNVTCKNAEGIIVLDDVSFTVNSGEILGIAGISGCGQKELLEAIAGLQGVEAGGSILYYSPQNRKTTELVGKSPRKIRDLGVALSFVPEDRLGMGLVGSMGMTENMMLRYYNDNKTIFAEMKKPRKLALKIKEELDVATPGIDTPVRALSGGNVQKVLVGREIAASPTVLMTAYAVRGLDIHTSYTIYRLLNEQKQAGVAVIYVGEDLDVLLEISDRIMVLCGGRVNGIVDARTTTKSEVGLLMTNMRKEAQHD